MTFGGFTFASEVLLGKIAGFYGFFIPEAEKQTSLADFVQARLRGKPILGDHITFEDIELVIQDIQDERITKVGLEFEPWGRVCSREREPRRGGQSSSWVDTRPPQDVV
jgi:NhaP-type Na+/H+ and K+/H+ antiporter